jgi:hypothetical protein
MNDDQPNAQDRAAAGLPAISAELALQKQLNLIASPVDQTGRQLMEDAQRQQTLMKGILT